MSGNPKWNKKQGLITGGTSGLGRAVAEACARRGMDVTLVARDADRLGAEADRLGALNLEVEVRTFQADFSIAGEATRVVAEAGPLDLLCHAAGLSSRGRVIETTRDDFERLLAINFLAAAELAAASAEGLAARRGHLVLIGSLATRSAPPLLGAYPASKHPLAALAQQLRLEMGPDGLHTLLVCPGPIARDDAGNRYDTEAEGLPNAARQPGGGAKLRALDPAWLSEKILNACDARKPELVLPRKARLLFILSAISPSWGDWLLRRAMKS